MNPKDKSGSKITPTLREEAEERLSEKQDKKLSHDDLPSLIHELEVHQIELEMQNEQLRKTERELEKSREKYFDLYDLAPVAYLTLDEKGVISEMNLTAAGFLGTERKSLVNQSFYRFIEPECQDTFYLHLQEVLRSATKQACELVLKKNDGSFFPVQLDSNRLEINGQRVLHTVLTDITERKQAEEELQKSEEASRAVLSATTESILLIDLQDVVLAANSVTAQRLGCRVEDVIGRNVYDFLPPEVSERRKAYTEQVMSTGEAVTFEDQRLGRWMHNSIYPIKDDGGRVTRLAIFGEDITERKRAEEELRQGTKTFFTVLDQLPSGVALIGTDSTYQYVNPEFTRITGYGLEDIPSGREWFQKAYPDPDERKTAVDAWKLDRFQNTGIARDREFTIMRSDGKTRAMNIGTSFLTDFSIVVLNDITERKMAEAELRRSESGLVEAQRIARIGSWEWDIVKDTARWSDETFRMFGVPLGTLEEHRENLLHYIHPEDRAKVNQALSDAVAGTREYDLEYRIVLLDGTEKVIHALGEVVRDDNSRPILMRGTVHDITERKRAELALQKTGERLRLALEATDLGTFDLDITTGIAVHSPRHDQILGYMEPVQEWTFELFLQHVLPEDIPLVLEAHARAEQTGALEFEARVAWPDGGIHWITARGAVRYDGEGYPVRLTGVVGDITERKQAEEKLRESEERFRNLVEGAPEAIFAQKGGRFVYVNPAMLNLLGASKPEELIDKELLELIAPEYHEAIRNRIKIQLETGKPVPPMEQEYLRLDGSRVAVETSAVPVRFQGADAHLVFVRDITERKRAEEDKVKLESQLRQSQKMEAIGTLAGGIAHDFNNILTVIMGTGNLVRIALERDEPVSKCHIDQIAMAAEKAARLTGSLLTLSRKQPVRAELHSVNSILEGTGKLLRRLLPEDINLNISIGAPQSFIMADAGQIDQILFNLAANARDAMPKGGLFTIETEEVELGPPLAVSDSHEKPGKYVLLSVSDTGIGMDVATKERIFEPFFTTKGVGKGTGLGLSAVYGIVKKHEGYIGVDSEPLQGTTFRIYFPLAEGKGVEDPFLSEEVETGTETVLVVEDDPGVRLLTTEILRVHGYKTMEATDGEEAVEVFKEHMEGIDLVILDVVMPKKSGREAYEEMNKIRPETKAIFTSGYLGGTLIDKGVAGEEIDFIAKPASPHTLLRKVREVLDR